MAIFISEMRVGTPKVQKCTGHATKGESSRFPAVFLAAVRSVGVMGDARQVMIGVIGVALRSWETIDFMGQHGCGAHLP